MLPLHQLVVDRDVTDLEVEAEIFPFACQLPHRQRDLLEHVLNAGCVGQADGGDRGNR